MALNPFKKTEAGSGKISASEIREKYNRSNMALQKEQWEYVINRAFLHNEQWVSFDRLRNTVAAIPREPDRLRVVFNKLWPASRHLMAKLLSRPLVFEVSPGEPDDGSIRGAHVAESVLADLARHHNWEEARENIAWSAWLGGTSVLALDWDQNYGGKKVGDREDGTPVSTGDICETALTILECAWEPGVRNAEKGLWWIRAQVLPPNEVMVNYDLDAKPASDATAAQGFMGRTLSLEDSGRPQPDLTLVLTYYERPNPKRPEGCVATVIGDKVCDVQPWPFPFTDRLNMVVFRETKMAGKAHGQTVFSAAVPVQVALNQSISNILEHLKLTGNARMLMPDTLDNIEELTDLPGEILTFNMAGGKPEWMAPAPMGNWVMESPAMLGAQLDDILGLHEVSRGVAPSNIESGVGLSVLVEQDTTPLGALTKELVHGFERFGCMVLETYSANVTDTRRAKISQKGYTPEIVEWNGASLAGQTVASIPMDAVMPRSRTALMAFAKELWDRKIIQDPQMFTKVADLPGQDDLLDAINSDTAKAQRENRDFGVGNPRVPRDFDDHAEHIRRHNDFRKTLRYEAMPEEWQKLVDDHLLTHERMAAEQAGNQAKKAMIHPGLPGVPTAGAEAPLMLPPGMPGAPAPGAPGVPTGREGMGPEAVQDPMQTMVPDQNGPVPS